MFGKKCWFPFLPVVPHLFGVQIGVQKFKNKRYWAGAGNQKITSLSRVIFCHNNYQYLYKA